MEDITQMLARLRRPKLLAKAAHYGAERYTRDRHLPFDLRIEGQTGKALVMQLMMQEAELNRMRKEGSANYPLRRHVQMLIALVAEARALSEDHPKASGSASFFCAT